MRRFYCFFFVLICLQAAAQGVRNDTLPLVDIQNKQFEKVLYSFEKKAKKLGLICPQSPSFVKVLLTKDLYGNEIIELTVEDAPRVVWYRGKNRLRPFKACHLHNDCLFLFSGNTYSEYIRYSGDSINIEYGTYTGPAIFLLDTNEETELAKILLDSQSTRITFEEPYRSKIIRSLELGAEKRMMKEWWSISWKKRHRDNLLIVVPKKKDILLYYDDDLIVYGLSAKCVGGVVWANILNLKKSMSRQP